MLENEFDKMLNDLDAANDEFVNSYFEEEVDGETYLIKFTDAKNILCDGQAFHFVGQAEEARIDYENRFYN